MNSRHLTLVTLLASVASANLAACTAGDTADVDSSESAQTSRAKLLLKNVGPRPIVLHAPDGAPISGGTGKGQTSTFEGLGSGIYTIKNDQTAKIGEIKIAAGDGQVTWTCGDVGCKKEPDVVATPPVAPVPKTINVQLLFAQKDFKLFAFPDLDHLERKISAAPGDRAFHDLPTGKPVGVEVWSTVRTGDKSGDWRTFDIPADGRFDGGVFFCALATQRVVNCSLQSADGKYVTTGDGKIGLYQRP